MLAMVIFWHRGYDGIHLDYLQNTAIFTTKVRAFFFFPFQLLRPNTLIT